MSQEPTRWDSQAALAREQKWLDRVSRPEIERALVANGHLPAPYISAVDTRSPEKGIRMRPGRARTSTGYGDLRRLPTVLVENHSLKPYRQRVLGTYILLEQALKTVAAHGDKLLAARAVDMRLRPDRIDIAWPQPVDTFLLHPVAREMYRSPASGRDEVRWLGRKEKPVRVPIFTARPSVVAGRPAAYWVPAAKAEVIDRLRRHGLVMQTLSSPRTLRVELMRVSGGRHDPAAEKEGRFPFAADGYEPLQREVTYAPGSVRVPTDQPLGELASVLLEARSSDSFLAWGLFPEILQRTEYIDGYVIAPLADRMLQTNPELARGRQSLELPRRALHSCGCALLVPLRGEARTRSLAVRRHTSATAAHRIRGAIRHAGHSCIFFPEGTFTRAPGLMPFHLDAFAAAVAAGVPVLPVAIRGTRSILRDEQWMPRRGRIIVTIDKPIMSPHLPNTFTAAVQLRDAARGSISRHCGEPDTLATRAQKRITFR